MAAGALLDTSFFITLAGKNRAHHEAARRYWRHLLENQIPIFLSTIVVSRRSCETIDLFLTGGGNQQTKFRILTAARRLLRDRI